MSSSDDDTRLLSNRTRAGRWQVDFPYEWDADDLVSRRQVLRWAVWASGALFAATAGLAGLTLARNQHRGGEQRIIESDAVPTGGVHYFHYPGKDDHAILLRLTEERFVAYSGKCTHLSCAVYWDEDREELICPCHEGVFAPETGDVIAGPPPRPLPRIVVTERDGAVYAIEEVPNGPA
ncbi:MAG TPA: Rieske (2Fe-2S) protein [Thermomicrobiales bacterium]|nr:Rieske (2Fe-2S) protein [Thermomicrobiales bacterium]